MLIDKLQQDKARFQALNEGFHFGAYPETFGNTNEFSDKDE